jgi:hypothetical protein
MIAFFGKRRAIDSWNRAVKHNGGFVDGAPDVQWLCARPRRCCMDRREAFETMLADIQAQLIREEELMRQLKSQGREKTATYRQYLSNRLLLKAMVDKYREYGLLES